MVCVCMGGVGWVGRGEEEEGRRRCTFRPCPPSREVAEFTFLYLFFIESVFYLFALVSCF